MSETAPPPYNAGLTPDGMQVDSSATTGPTTWEPTPTYAVPEPPPFDPRQAGLQGISTPPSHPHSDHPSALTQGHYAPAQSPYPGHPQSYDPVTPYDAAAPAPYSPLAATQPSLLGQVRTRLDEDGATTPSARKPFIMGLLTGIVLMLVLGQIFRATGPSPDYAQIAPPPIDMTITDEDDMAMTFLDRVETANPP